ncbi:hypothetical protein GQ457_10G018910 [Hibiscus cannabinus]
MLGFHESARLPRVVNSTFLVLIPKKDSHVGLWDFWPISLINSVYKIISKVLAGRLEKVLNGLISEEQSAFVVGRQIVDGVLMSNEVIHFLRQPSQSSFVLKLDFSKASARLSVLFNGLVTKEFGMGRGLRQGDPLSPLLFVLVTEALHVLLERAVVAGLVRGVEVFPGFALSHLQFADDTIMFFYASLEVARNVQRVLFFFQAYLGLQINFGKSSLVALGVEGDLVEEVAGLLRCEVGSLPFMYLGLPLGCNPREKGVWDPMVSRVRSRLAGWKWCSLSFAVRVTLVNSVLSSLRVYYMGVFVVPRGVIAL